MSDGEPVDRLNSVGQILDVIGVGFIAFTLESSADQFVVIAANESASPLIGVDLPCCMGLPFEEALPGAREAGVLALVAGVLRDGVAKWGESVSIPAPATAGQVFNLVAVPLDAIAGTTGAVGLIVRNTTAQVREARYFEARLVAAGGDEVVAIVPDVTERRRMELALIASKKELEDRVRARTAELRAVNEAMGALIDASPLGIISTGPGGVVLSWNGAAERIFGFTPGEAVGRFIPMVTREDVEEVRATLAASSGPADCVIERELRRKDGAGVHVRVRFAKLTSASGELSGLMALVEDVTAERNMREMAARGEQQMAVLRGVTAAVHRAADVDQLVRALREPLQEIGIEAGLLSIDLDAAGGAERHAWGVDPEAVLELRLDEEDCTNSTIRLAPEAAAQFRSCTAVPVVSRQGTRGSVLFLSSRPHPFDADLLLLLRVVGEEIAGALENIVLFRHMRTAMTVARDLSLRITTIRQSERRHLGRELHDQLGQSLTALKLSLEAGSRRGAPAAEDLHAAALLVGDLIGEVRNISLMLRESRFDAGLLAALEAGLARFSRDTGMTIDFAPSGVDDELPPDVELTVYRVVQEALTNVARHACAPAARVTVTVTAAEVTARIEDRGSGFDAPAALSGTTRGLSGMMERVALAGGSVTIDSRPGEGTRVDLAVPLAVEERQA